MTEDGMAGPHPSCGPATPAQLPNLERSYADMGNRTGTSSVPPIIAQLERHRINLGLARSAAAALVGVPGGTLLTWEHGRRSPSVVTLHHWADALECDVVFQPTPTRYRRPVVRSRHLSKAYHVPPVVAALRRRRLEMGWSVGRVADAVHVGYRTFQSWELGDRSPAAPEVDRWATVLFGSLQSVPRATVNDDAFGPSVDETDLDLACAGLVDPAQIRKDEGLRAAVVGRLAAKGKTAAEIAVAIGTSTRTAQRELQPLTV